MFYEDLKNQREKLGFSVEQIANRIKVNKSYLEDFESGNFSNLPKTYIRLFLRSYANEVGLDANEILAAFEQLTSGQPVPPSAEIVKKKEPIVSVRNGGKSPVKSRRSLVTITIFVVVIVFLISILKQVLLEEEKNDVLIQPQLPINMSVNTNSPDSTLLPSESEDNLELKAIVPQSRSLSLVLQSRDSCWVRLIIDNKDSLQVILPPNVLREWKAQTTFDLRIARPSVVSLSLNNRDLGMIGQGNRPVRVLIDKSGIVKRQLITKP
ncbi:MAG: RodZ domain-containing protein [Candidatus Neomarinimicrobiota bacterium]